MQFALDPNDIQAIAKEVAKSLRGTASTKATAKDPMQDPANWVRATDLDKHIKMAKSTLNSYVRKGKIGKAKLTGCTYYYLPDIGNLLKEHYYKAEAIEGLMKAVQGERRTG